MARHAVAAEDKEARRNLILSAARKLFAGDPSRLPSAALIAEHAGLAKGTLYLYFRTKEEIFLTLLRVEWAGLFECVHRAFQSDRRQAKRRIADFILEYTAYVECHPDLLRLDALSYSVLERNLTYEALKQHKRKVASAIDRAGLAIEESLLLTNGEGSRLLIRTYALTSGLWQALDYPKERYNMMNDPALATLRLTFLTELHETLVQYWRGAACLDLKRLK